MTFNSELKKVKDVHPWAKTLFVNDIVEKNKAEIGIIDSFYDIYKIYPEYYLISDLFEELDNERISKIVLKLKGTVKSFLAGGAGVIAAELSGLDMNVLSFWSTLAVIAGGSEALYLSNKKDLNLKFTKEEKRVILETFIEKCDEFEESLNNYSYAVQNYVTEYMNDDEIDWLSSFRKIIIKHYDYIVDKKEKGKFNDDFDHASIVELYNKIFNSDEFNSALTAVRESNNEENNKSRK